MRAGFGALADKSLPSLIAVAEGEVAAAFKGILKILTGNLAGLDEKLIGWHYQSTRRSRYRARVWQGKAGCARWTSDLRSGPRMVTRSEFSSAGILPAVARTSFDFAQDKPCPRRCGRHAP